MKNKVTIKNSQGQYLQHVIFEDKKTQDEWIQMLVDTSTWGKAEHQIEILDETGMSLDPQEFQTIPSEYIVEIVDVTAEVEDQELKIARAQAGARARAACDNALDIVAGYNLERELTPEQITTMTTTFGAIMMALSVERRPGRAKGLIELVNPDGVIITEAMKADLLEALQEY